MTDDRIATLEARMTALERRQDASDLRQDAVEVSMLDLKTMVAALIATSVSTAAAVARIEGWEKYFVQVAEVHAALVPDVVDPDPTPNMRGPR